MYWDEDNRLMVLSDNGKTSRYTYNAAGERIMKSYGTMGALRSIDYNKYFVIGLVHDEVNPKIRNTSQQPQASSQSLHPYAPPKGT